MGAVQHCTCSTAASCLKSNILSLVLCSHNLLTVYCTKKSRIWLILKSMCQSISARFNIIKFWSFFFIFFVQGTVNRLWEHNYELRILDFKQLVAVERVQCWIAPIYFSNLYTRDLVIKMTQHNRADFYDSNAYKIIHIQPFVVEIWPLQVTTSEVAHFDVIRTHANYDANSNKD